MTKKSHSFDKLGDQVCVVRGCSRKLKQRIIEEKPTANKCYKHWSEAEKIRRNRDRTKPVKS